MASKFPSNTLRRVQLPSQCICKQQQRNATLLTRPHTPYTFTQLITQTDGSTFTIRTTSPAPVFRCTKDTRNSALWNPSLQSLRNVEQDEAGRLRAFRDKFGRGWDLDAEEGVEEGGNEVKGGGNGEGDSLMDLIAGSAGVGAGAKAKGKGKEGVVESKGEGEGEQAKEVKRKVDKGRGSS